MSKSVIVTFIRHGESTDNLRSVWAGWQDAPLSNHGVNQARALGEFFADTPFTAIHASDLKRAFATAQALYDGQKDSKPTFDSSELLREQNFGVAEGKPWSYKALTGLTLEEQIAQGVYPVLYGNGEKFPEGESINDLAERAKRAVDKLVLPHVWKAAKEGRTGIHIAIVSHGLCISQLISELIKTSAKQDAQGDYRGLLNTAWTRVEIDIEGAQEDQSIALDDVHPLLVIRVTDVNRHSHIDNVTRQKGGIGSAAYDPKQKDIRAFFGGKTENLSISESNAHDEVTGTGDTAK
ncbi:histidine phosphatase superfamily [Multifurca ochricompacta]|uniref:Histidine phosphatase superfamily n=1 Tax=Multifurca ochricompacta TaxID=376703 RepID=A0AAD4QNY6_9AGAM|nr:histidine phosphatase superfamily [Multifurca ochricompacta]